MDFGAFIACFPDGAGGVMYGNGRIFALIVGLDISCYCLN
jgi:hypothetical protein